MSLLKPFRTVYTWLLRRLALKFLGYDHHISESKKQLVVINSDGLERLLNDIGAKTSVYRVSVDEAGKATLHTFANEKHQESPCPVVEEADPGPPNMHRSPVRVESPPGEAVGATERHKETVASVFRQAESIIGRDLFSGR